MSRFARSLVAFSLVLFGCAKQPTPTVQPSRVPLVALATPAVYTLRCQLYYYPLGATTESDPAQQPEQQTLTVQGDGQGEVTLAGLRFSASYALGQAHHSGVKLELTAEGALLLSQLFELPDALPPTDLGSGFTGVVALKRPGHAGDYQYSCELLPAPPSA